MVLPVEALLHKKEVPPVAVSTWLPPTQMAGAEGVMAAKGLLLTVTSFDSVAEHPLASVTVTK